jgi:hypothetical protein
MGGMKVVVTFVAVVLFACQAQRTEAPAPAGPTAVATSETELQAVDARYGVYLARLEIRTTITPDGRLRTVRTLNKSYSPADKVVEQTEVRAGQLTDEQIKELARLFAGWEALKDVYPNAADGPEVSIRYGDKIVTGGTGLPRQVWDVHRRVIELGTEMAVVEK